MPVKRTVKKKAIAKPDDDAKRTDSALAAKLKQHRGGKLTQAQARDLAWYDKRSRDALAAELYRAVPKGVFCEMAARQQKVIDEQADRYDLPIDSATVDLFAAIKAYHDLITANHRFIRPADDAAAIANGDVDELQVHQLHVAKLQEEVNKLRHSNQLATIKVRHATGDTIDRGELRRLLSWLSTRLEGFGQQLRRSSGGDEAQTCLNEFLEHLAAECTAGVLQV